MVVLSPTLSKFFLTRALSQVFELNNREYKKHIWSDGCLWTLSDYRRRMRACWTKLSQVFSVSKESKIEQRIMKKRHFQALFCVLWAFVGIFRGSSTTGCLLQKQHVGRKAWNKSDAAWAPTLWPVTLSHLHRYPAVIKTCYFCLWANSEGGGDDKLKEGAEGGE